MVMIPLMHDEGYEVPTFIHPDCKKVLDKARKMIYEKNKSFFTIFDGRSGIGKTTTAIQYAKYLDPKFTIDNISWTPEDFVESMQNAKKGEAVLFDEGMILSSRSAMSKANRMIMTALSQIRSRNIFVIICINSVFDIDKNTGMFVADVLFHLYNKNNVVDGEIRMKVYGRDKLKNLIIKGKAHYSYFPHPNFFARPSRKYVFLLNEEEYESRKRKKSNENTENGKKESKRQLRYKITLAKLLAYLKKQEGFVIRDVANSIQETPQSLSKIIVWARDEGFIADKKEKDTFIV